MAETADATAKILKTSNKLGSYLTPAPFNAKVQTVLSINPHKAVALSMYNIVIRICIFEYRIKLAVLDFKP